MRLLRDIWELVDGPKPPRTRKKRKWLSFSWRFSWRGIGVIVLSFLVAADLPPQPVIVTEELSFEVVNQIEEASEACRDARETGGSSCATEVWKSCHLADQTLDNFKESPSLGNVQAKMYLCGLAVIADAGDLAKSLASRYGDQYYTSGWFKTVKVDEGNTSFLLFKDLLIVELSTLIKPVNSGTPLADQYSIIRTPISIAIDKYSGYSSMSDDTEKKLIALRSSVIYSFRTYAGPGSSFHGDFYAAGIREDQDWQAIGRNLWQQPPGSAHNHGITEQNCRSARIADRENRHGWGELLDYCFQLADDCANRADSFSVSCSLAKGAAEFESMWQRLPEVCATSEGNDEQLASTERTSNIEEPTGVGEPASDACYQAALAICEYQNVSPDDEWIDQLISMRDFACAAASRTPDLQYVKVDDRVPYYRVPYPRTTQ